MREMTERVKQIGGIQITGDIIPSNWYKEIKFENGKTDAIGVMILANIFYWYRPSIIEDEHTGHVIRYERKFKEDKLQRSYDQISEFFGITKRQATDAIIRLESLGLIKREFRSLKVKGMTLNNVLFIDIMAERVNEISNLAKVDAKLSTVPRLNVIAPTLDNEIMVNLPPPLTLERGNPLTLERDTNTEITNTYIIDISKSDISSKPTAKNAKNISKKLTDAEAAEALEKLSVGDIKDWLIEKRQRGLFVHADEELVLENFKDYCYSSGKKYLCYKAALRKAFLWESNQPKLQTVSKGEQYANSIRRVQQAALEDIANGNSLKNIINGNFDRGR